VGGMVGCPEVSLNRRKEFEDKTKRNLCMEATGFLVFQIRFRIICMDEAKKILKTLIFTIL
jgi:hypothetical protein